MKRRMFSVLVACVLIISLFTGCASKPAPGPSTPAPEPAAKGPSSSQPLVLQLSHVFSKGTPMDTSVVTAAENIKKRTDGAIEIQISSNGTLPNGVDGFEQVVRGANFINLYDPSAMADWVPDYIALMGPFLVDNREEFKKLTESDLVKEMNKKAEEKGLKVLALPFNFGSRHIASGKIKVESPADLKGAKFRVPGSQVFIKTFQALGANTITTPSSEVYNAIQTGLADANESSIADLAQMQMQEVVDYISLTGHFIGTSSAVMSTKVFDSLTPEQQTIILEEFQSAAEVCSKEYADLEVIARKKFEDAGVQFVTVDKTPFKEMTEIIYSQETFPNLSADIYKRLQAELAK